VAHARDAGHRRLRLSGRGLRQSCVSAAVSADTNWLGPRAEERGMRTHRVRSLAAVCAIAAGLASCAAEPQTPLELCEALLESKLPDAEVVTRATESEGRLELGYALPDDGGVGSLVCEVERSALGGPRLRAAQLDGRPLSDTELVVRNANLLLDDLYALGSRRG
jgi:hypothetical protein